MKALLIIVAVGILTAIVWSSINTPQDTQQEPVIAVIDRTEPIAPAVKETPSEEIKETQGLAVPESQKKSAEIVVPEKSPEKKPFEQKFIRDGLETNTAIASVPISDVLGGGPGKDGIPAIDNPIFITVPEAQKIEDEDTNGLIVTVGNTTRFYPYNILVWHEIVNDVIEGVPLAVTFCPLCGSGIVFNTQIDDTVERFGVSGKLWESNLLMYDQSTESLWSQAIGRAVVGERTGDELDVYPSQLSSFGEFIEDYPEGEVLSRKTGSLRTYDFYPYGGYDESEQLYFPVSIEDKRFFGKEIMYVVPTETQSVAFLRSDLINAGGATVETNSGTLTATVEGSSISVTDISGNTLPGYHEMWFSWATHHQDDGIVWPQ